MIRPGDAQQLFVPNLPYRMEGSPFIRLLGDEFCSSTESALYLLENINQTVGGGALTNNGATFAFDSDFGNIVASFSGSSQYLFRATEAQLQVGTNSFMASIAFKTSTTGAFQFLFFNGKDDGSHPFWQMWIHNDNTLRIDINDGTNDAQVIDPIKNRWQDGRWHIATMIVDRTSNIMYLICDGSLIGTITISNVTGTLTLAGSNLLIGAQFTGSTINFFNGSLALFKLINNAADYNVPAVWNMGIRESVSAGTWAVNSNSNNRMNNQFSNTSATTGDYSYCTIVTEDGEYEIQANLDYLSNGGQAQVLIDGNPVTWSTKNAYIDTYNGSTTYNNITKAYGFKLSAGRHTVKLLSNAKNGSSSAFLMQFAWINFIKRRGHENGGLTRALLLGDELNERSNEAFSGSANTNMDYNNQWSQTSTIANSDYHEASLYIKGGLYRIDILYTTFNTFGKFDLLFGNVQVSVQLDMYSASIAYNNLQSVYVRLQQGRQNIRMAANGKNGSSTNYGSGLQSIKIERLAD